MNAQTCEWFGVQVVSEGTRTRSNLRLATVITVILGWFLLTVQFVLPSFSLELGSYSRLESFDPKLFWPAVIGLLIFGWLAAFVKWQFLSGIGDQAVTLNTEVGPASAGELLKELMSVRYESAPYATAMRELTLGHLALSARGLEGIVTIPWKSISLVSFRSENTIQIKKRELLPSIGRLMGLSPVILRFAGAKDAAEFVALASKAVDRKSSQAG